MLNHSCSELEDTARKLSMKIKFAALSALVSCSGMTLANAAEIEEIVVTATKRGAANIQDIPISVHSIGAERLHELDITEFEDYFRRVPGLSVDNGGPGDKRFIVRGINARGAGAVGVYFDEVVITGENADNGTGRQADVKLFDIERLEVLRGPQGTTFGSSSMTGTIRIIPNTPVMDSFSVTGGAGFSSTKESDDSSWKTDFAINVPVVADKLAVRLSALKMDQAGYIDNRFAEDDNNDDSEAARGMLTWKVTEDLQLDLLAMWQEQMTNARPFYNDVEATISTNPNFNGAPVTADYFNVNLSRAGFEDEMKLFNAKATLERDWGTITATTSQFDRDSLFDRDSSVSLEILSGGALPADGAGRSIISQFKDRKVNTSELRFVSAWEGPLEALVGIVRQEEDRRLATNIPVTDAATGFKVPNGLNLFGRAHEASLDETAIFSEWVATVDRFSLTAGVRIADFDIVNQDFATVNFGGSPGPGPGPRRTTSEQNTTFRFNVSYQPTEDSMAYVQVAEGFRAGGANNTAAGALVGVAIPEGFGSDSLINYEVGGKATWLGGSLTTNGALYYIDWSDIQSVQQATSPEGLRVPYVGNVGSANVYGLELELSGILAEGLYLDAGANFTRARFAEDFPDLSQGLDGDDIPYVPEISLMLDARYERPLGKSDLLGFLGADWSYTGEQTNNPRPTDPRYEEIGGYSIVNVRAGINGDDWSATLSLENALDEDQIIQYVYDFSGPPPPHYPDGLVRPWPQTLSIQFRKSFGM